MGFSESEFGCQGIYDLVHPDDLAYVASAHAECKLAKCVHDKLCMINGNEIEDKKGYLQFKVTPMCIYKCLLFSFGQNMTSNDIRWLLQSQRFV